MASIVLAASLFLTFTAMAQSTNSPSAAEVQGQTLTSEILSETPATNFTQTGVLRIRNSGGSTNIPVTFETVIGTDRWQVHYAAGKPGMLESLMIVHQNYEPNEYYFLSTNAGTVIDGSMTRLNHDQIMSPFAGSDFSIADLGLEFFHWPDQKVTGHETRRMRDCTKLESDDPNPGGYSRVVTWIDDQTLGIIHAEAYDANGKLLKVFDPKSLKKVNGQWELQDIEIRNVQTRSRTRIQFNLNGKS
ncbi:MAG TPA: outer membrane lipoprotein-sorting protein [Candidatus Acidoferrales bacterium]|nr:outer membrane lipoprotein-sorting protein [Candidatus Acidoferrales bacterium]